MSSRDEHESKLQAWFIDEATRLGMIAYKTVAPGRRGWPDVLVAFNHYVCLVEIKAASTPLEPQQKSLHKKLGAHIDVYVARGREQAATVLCAISRCWAIRRRR